MGMNRSGKNPQTMTASSDSDRSESQGGFHEEPGTQEGRVLGMAYSGLGARAIARHWIMQSARKTKILNNSGFIIPWGFAEAGK